MQWKIIQIDSNIKHTTFKRTMLPLTSLKMEAVCSTKASVNFCQTTGYHFPEGTNHYSHHCESLRWHKE